MGELQQIVVPRDVAELAMRAIRRDMNFAYEMASHWYQKGPFSSVDKGNAAQDYAKRCEDALSIMRLALGDKGDK